MTDSDPTSAEASWNLSGTATVLLLVGILAFLLLVVLPGWLVATGIAGEWCISSAHRFVPHHGIPTAEQLFAGVNLAIGVLVVFSLVFGIRWIARLLSKEPRRQERFLIRFLKSPVLWLIVLRHLSRYFADWSSADAFAGVRAAALLVAVGIQVLFAACLIGLVGLGLVLGVLWVAGRSGFAAGVIGASCAFLALVALPLDIVLVAATAEAAKNVNMERLRTALVAKPSGGLLQASALRVPPGDHGLPALFERLLDRLEAEELADRESQESSSPLSSSGFDERASAGSQRMALGDPGAGEPFGLLSDGLEEGDSDRFGECLKRLWKPNSCRDWVEYLLLGRLMTPEDVEDSLSDSAIATCQKSRDDECQYFMAVAINRANRLYRQEQVHLRRCWVAPLPSCPAPTLDESLLLLEEAAIANAAYCALPQGDQEVLRLSLELEMNAVEIARELEISHDAARQRLHRAEKRLEEKINEQCPMLPEQ